MPTSGFRVERVADRVRDEVSRVFSREISDPRLDGVRVLRVEVSGDLQIAWIYLGMGQADSAELRQRALSGTESAKGRIRKLISSRLGMRRVPDLRFSFDEAADEESRIMALLSETR